MTNDRDASAVDVGVQRGDESRRVGVPGVSGGRRGTSRVSMSLSLESLSTGSSVSCGPAEVLGWGTFTVSGSRVPLTGPQDNCSRVPGLGLLKSPTS